MAATALMRPIAQARFDAAVSNARDSGPTDGQQHKFDPSHVINIIVSVCMLGLPVSVLLVREKKGSGNAKDFLRRKLVGKPCVAIPRLLTTFHSPEPHTGAPQSISLCSTLRRCHSAGALVSPTHLLCHSSATSANAASAMQRHCHGATADLEHDRSCIYRR